MTNEQKEKINEMRRKGIGYKQIAKNIGLSRDSVRGYCKRHGLEGFGKELLIQHKKLMQEEFMYILCLQCGKEIEQKSVGRKRKYCSMDCKREWDKNHRQSYDVHCLYCGKEFRSLGIKNVRYCTHECYIKDRFWRQEDAQDIANKILQFKKINNLPMWLKELLLDS